MAGVLPAQSPEALLGAALHQEEVEGNLEAAIATYKKVLAQPAGNRALAARAQFRIGVCYERLGQGEARKAYERVLSNYADQREVVTQARARLAALGHPAGTGPVARRVWAGFGGIAGTPSADGRFFTFTDWTTGDLAVWDVATGQSRRLTNKGSWEQSSESAQFSAPSPDGKLVAYTWKKKDNRFDLRLIGIDGSNPRVLYSSQDVRIPEVDDWSPDGKHILAHMWLGKGEPIVLVSVADGSVRPLKTVHLGDARRPRFSPDGRYIAYDQASSDSRQYDIFVMAADGSRDTPVVTHPANELLLGWAPDGRSIVFASDRTGSMSAYVIPVVDGKPAGAPELVKRDLGSVWPMGITRQGSLFYVIFTGANDVYTASLDLAAGRLTTKPERVAQRFVGSNYSPGWSPDGRRLAFISLDDNLQVSSSFLSIVSIATGEQRELSPKPNWVWRPRWSPDGRSILVRGRDQANRFGLYRVDPQSGDATVIVQSKSNVYGWFPDGRAIYYDRPDNTGKLVQIVVRNLETGQERELPGGPWPEAAGLALSPDGRQIAFLTHDDAARSKVVKILSVAGGESRDLLKGNSIGLDSELAWTPDGRGILFVEKGELWRVPVDGGAPQALGLKMGQLRQLHLSPDGRQIAFTAGEGQSEVWVLENFLPGRKGAR